MPPPESDELVLRGALEGGSTRSLLPIPISATIGTSSLDVNFLFTVGDINVEVYNSFGELIYETSVDSSTQSSISIDVTGWDSDSYEIRFVSSSGNYVYGSFEID
jgi:hypothetical protein